MGKQSWNSIEEFIEDNKYEFIHVNTEAEYQEEIKKIKQANDALVDVLYGKQNEFFDCKRRKPVYRRVCRWVGQKYECDLFITYVCVER